MQQKQEKNWSILLHDIRSVQNVASIFRLCEVFGVNQIFLSGVTPGPLDRFGREREDFSKIALGAEKSVRYQRINDNELDENSFSKLSSFVAKFKEEKGEILALEQNSASIDYREYKIENFSVSGKKYLLLPGREREGLDQEIVKMCDKILEIPQYGSKESLNIFSATSILVARLFG